MAALVFSLVGDVLLMLPGNTFIPGLASFLVAHVFYIALCGCALGRLGCLHLHGQRLADCHQQVCDTRSAVFAVNFGDLLLRPDADRAQRAHDRELNVARVAMAPRQAVAHGCRYDGLRSTLNV